MAGAWFREWRGGMTESCCSKRSEAERSGLASFGLGRSSARPRSFIGVEGSGSKGDGVWCSSPASTHTVLSL